MQSSQEEMLLGVDYGQTNTGLAFGRSGLASPLEVLNSKDQDTLVSRIARVSAENKITKIVMGLPIDDEGRETAQSLKVRQFAKILRIKLKRPVEFVSEYGTTQEAIEGAIHTGVSKKRRQTNDHYSAALILKRYYREESDEI